MSYTNAVESKIKGAFAADVAHGLSRKPKFLYSKYIYDDEGSRLFEEIMDLEEYYLTNSERELLESHKNEYASLIDDDYFNVVELGAGNGNKTRILLEHFLKIGKKFTFRPIDISKLAIDKLEGNLNNTLSNLTYKGMVADYFEGLNWLKANSYKKNLVLFLGSNIGNFIPEDRNYFLKQLKESLKPGDLVAIGFDLKKNAEIINKAYNDKEGVTEAFNFNLLHRINRELAGNFNPSKFQFYARYNPFEGAVESCLISTGQQKVIIEALDKTYSFDAWEPIHTESSYKYSFHEISKIAENNGFRQQYIWTDSRNYYANAIWECV